MPVTHAHLHTTWIHLIVSLPLYISLSLHPFLLDKVIPYGNTVFDGVQAQLTVQDAVCADEGSYSCVAENEHGQAVCTGRVLVKGMIVFENLPRQNSKL